MEVRKNRAPCPSFRYPFCSQTTRKLPRLRWHRGSLSAVCSPANEPGFASIEEGSPVWVGRLFDGLTGCGQPWSVRSTKYYKFHPLILHVIHK